ASSAAGMSKEHAALLIERSMQLTEAPSMRAWLTRFPPASTTAIFIGCPISRAFSSAAAMTQRASLNVIMASSSELRLCRIPIADLLQRIRPVWAQGAAGAVRPVTPVTSAAVAQIAGEGTPSLRLYGFTAPVAYAGWDPLAATIVRALAVVSRLIADPVILISP